VTVRLISAETRARSSTSVAPPTRWDHQQLASALEEWRHIAEANGGFSMADVGPVIARDLKAGLRVAARRAPRASCSMSPRSRRHSRFISPAGRRERGDQPNGAFDDRV
jgi:hypothetical protein